jgi:hypothetical protein
MIETFTALGYTLVARGLRIKSRLLEVLRSAEMRCLQILSAEPLLGGVLFARVIVFPG